MTLENYVSHELSVSSHLYCYSGIYRPEIFIKIIIRENESNIWTLCLGIILQTDRDTIN